MKGASSIAWAVIALIIVVVLIGLVTGLALSETEALNPLTARAEARRMDQETDTQAQWDAIDLEIYGQEQTAQLDFQRRQWKQELVHQVELQTQELAHRVELHEAELRHLEMRETAITVALCLDLFLVGGGVTFLLISLGHWVRSRASSREMRETVRRLAQANERLARSRERPLWILDEGSGGGDGRQEVPTGRAAAEVRHAGC